MQKRDPETPSSQTWKGAVVLCSHGQPGLVYICVTFVLLHNNFPQNLVALSNTISVSVSLESRYCRAGSSGSESFTRWHSSCDSAGKEAVSKLTHMMVVRIPFLVCHWPEAVLSFLPHGPFLGHLHHRDLPPQNEQANEKTESECQWEEITVLYNLMLEVISHHFCRILLIGSNEVQPSFEGGVLHEDVNARRQGALGPS